MTAYLNNAFDLKRIENELLKPLELESSLDKELVLLDIQMDEYNVYKKYTVDRETIILFEGVLLYRDPIDRYFDYRIFLDISFDEVISRAVERDGYLFGEKVKESYQNKYIPIQKIYLKQHNPIEKSNIVILNEDYHEPKIIRKA